MFVYILESLIDGSHYVGLSATPDRRLAEHNKCKVQSTKAKCPWKRIYLEECLDRIDARKREKYLKSVAGRRFRKSLCHGSSVG